MYHKQKHIEHSGFHITTPHSHSLQEVSYNAFKKPVDVYEKGHGRLSFKYSPMLTRSHVWYGGEEETKTDRRYRKYYTSIAPIAIEEDTEAKTTKIITYIGGDAYTAPVVSISSAAATGNSSTTAYYYITSVALWRLVIATEMRWRTEREENSLWLFLANGPAGAPGGI